MGVAARNFAEIANKYAREAAADKRHKKYCKWVRLAAQRHLDDLKKSNRRSFAYRFDEWHAADICGFIEKLPHIEGKWETPHIVLEPAQIFILALMFGWRRKEDGLRRFTTAYIELARKNAKSTLAAGVALYCLTCEGEVGPQIIIGATTGEQAQKVFRPAKQMVERTPPLREAFGLEALAKSIPCYQNSGFIQTINAKSSTQDGWNPHVGVLDELHAHKDRGLYDVIRSAFGARRNPLLWIITTAGYDVTGVCYEQRTLVTKILQGVVRAEHYFGIIYTLDEGDDEFDPAVWIKANPLLGKSVQLNDLKGYAAEAKASPDSHGEFLTKRLNVWTRAKKGHVNVRKWQKCDGQVILDDLVSIPCWGALDVGAVSDMTAFRLVWELPLKAGQKVPTDAEGKPLGSIRGRVQTWGRFYLPEQTVVPRTERGNVPYQTWAKEGKLVVTPGEVTDYAYIERDISWALSTFKVQGIAFDPWNARDIANRLLDDNAPMIEFRQGIPSFNGPMKELDRLYVSGRLDHDGDEILAWNASNIVARKDVNENIAPDRLNSQEKIDGYVTLVMALGLMIGNKQEGQGFTATHGVVTLR